MTEILIGRNKQMARTVRSQLDRQILRGVMAGIFGSER